MAVPQQEWQRFTFPLTSRATSFPSLPSIHAINFHSNPYMLKLASVGFWGLKPKNCHWCIEFFGSLSKVTQVSPRQRSSQTPPRGYSTCPVRSRPHKGRQHFHWSCGVSGGSKPFLHLLAEPLSNLQKGFIRKTHVVEILVNLKDGNVNSDIYAKWIMVFIYVMEYHSASQKGKIY